MKRPLIVGILVVALAAVGGLLAWNTASRDRQYRHLIAGGEAALVSGQTLLAIESFSGAIALKPDSMLAYLKRGETYRQHGDIGAAMRDLRKASVLDRSATRPLEQLGDAFVVQGQFARAADRYQAFLRIDDRSPRLLYKLGLAWYVQGNTAAAIPPLRQAVSLNDRFAEGYYLLGVCLRAEEQRTEALWALQRAIRLAPDLRPARETLADLFDDLNRQSDRIEQLETLASLEPDRVDRAIALAMARAETGRTNLAVLVLERAAERHRDDPRIYTALSSVWLHIAEVDGDAVALDRALEAIGRIVAAGHPATEDLVLQGRALLLSGDPAAALPVLREAAARVPVNPEACRFLASAAEATGALPEAREALERAATLAIDERDQAAAYARVAGVALRMHDPSDAVRWLDRAVRATPRDGSLLPRLAEAQLAAGTVDAARETIRLALAAGVDTPALRAVRTRVENLSR